MPEIRVLLVDDRPFARTGLRSVLTGYPDIQVVGEAADLDQALELGRELRPTVVVANGQLADADLAHGIDGLRRLSPPPHVLVLTSSAGDHAYHAMRAGATGLLFEQSNHHLLVSALRMAAAGYLMLAQQGPAGAAGNDSPPARAVHQPLDRLTQRELDVLELIARGHSNTEISSMLALSRNTVKSHVCSVLVKLGLPNRVAAVIYAYQVGLAHGEPAAPDRPRRAHRLTAPLPTGNRTAPAVRRERSAKAGSAHRR